MDTKKETADSEVPTFKVARVGNDRKRKGAGFSFLRGGGARGVWSGAAGGSGAGGAAIGAGLSKMALIALVSFAGLGAAGLGRMLGNTGGSEIAKPKTFSMATREAVKIEGDVSNLPGNTNTIPNSLGYLTGSKDGLTPEERAKKEADAAAAAEAQRVADEAAAKKAEKDNVAGAPVDPAAMLASAKADGGNGGKGAGFGKKFGSLSSSMGGSASLAGGSGMSGGVNRQFGGAGALGKGTAGQMQAMRGSSNASTTKASASRLAASRTKGFARKQLANSNAYSRRGAAAGKGETASSDAASAFDNNPGSGNIIAGPGISKGSKPQGEADNAGGPVGGGGGGGRNTPTDCGADMYQTSSGGCAPLDTGVAKDAKPMLTMMANVVMGLLMVIGILSLLASGAEKTVFGYAWAKVVESVILALGIIITLLGVAMIAMGDYVTGGIATLLGGTTTAMALWAVDTLSPGVGMVIGFGGAALSMVGKMMDKGNHKGKAPEAAQQ